MTLRFVDTMEDENLIDFNEARPAGLHSLKLPAFWVDKPVSWFVLAESRFRLHCIHREQTRYDYLVSALKKEAVSLVLDVVEHPPEHHPYSALKQSLLDSHQLSDYQKIAALHKMEPLGGRKPLELLASMLELCPRGHETSIFFTHLFLERLPAELRITLGEDSHQNVRALAKKADALWSLHGMKTSFSTPVASLVELEEPSTVVAVSSCGSGCGGRTGGHGGRSGRGGVSRGGGQQPGGLQVASQPYSPRSWRGFRVASAWPTSTTGTRPSPALHHAAGETSGPGASQHRIPRTAGSYHGPALAKVFSRGHWVCLFCLPLLFHQSSMRTSIVWSGWPADSVLG